VKQALGQARARTKQLQAQTVHLPLVGIDCTWELLAISSLDFRLRRPRRMALQNNILHFLESERNAYELLEAQVWPGGPRCPHCGDSKKLGKLKGRRTRVGTHKCYACRKPFNAKLGTVFESSNIPLHVWLRAIYLLSLCSKPISVYRLQSILGVTQKTAAQVARAAARASRPKRSHAQNRNGVTSNAGRSLDPDPPIANEGAAKESRSDNLFNRFIAAMQEFNCAPDAAAFEVALQRIVARKKQARPRKPASTRPHNVRAMRAREPNRCGGAG
jgi:transposase-like protein